MQSYSDLTQTLRENLEAEEAHPIIAHCERVEAVAVRLGEKWGFDLEKVRLAVWAHDLVRMWSPLTLLSEAERRGLPIDEVDRGYPILLHGPVAAHRLLTEFQLQEQTIIQAVDCHTTLRRHPGELDELLFLADKIEPSKVEWDPETRLEEALTDLRGAVRHLARDMNLLMREEGIEIHPRFTNYLREAGLINHD